MRELFVLAKICFALGVNALVLVIFSPIILFRFFWLEFQLAWAERNRRRLKKIVASLELSDLEKESS